MYSQFVCLKCSMLSVPTDGKVTYTNASGELPKKLVVGNVLRFLTGASVIPPGGFGRNIRHERASLRLNLCAWIWICLKRRRSILICQKKHCKTKHLMQLLTITVMVMTIYRVYYKIYWEHCDESITFQSMNVRCWEHCDETKFKPGLAKRNRFIELSSTHHLIPPTRFSEEWPRSPSRCPSYLSIVNVVSVSTTPSRRTAMHRLRFRL